MLDRELIRQFNEFKPDSLGRSDDLGVHYNFKQAVPVLTQYYELLKEIIDSEAGLLTQEESKVVSAQISKLLQLRNRILNFNPKESDNAATYQQLNNDINASWQQAAIQLRPIYSFLRIRSLNTDSLNKKAEMTLVEIKRAQDHVNTLIQQIQGLPSDTEIKFNQSFKHLQERLTNQENSLRDQFNSLKAQFTEDISKGSQSAVSRLQELEGRMAKLTSEANEKIDAVLQQARKFSAKSALVTYAEIFKTEAENVNKPAILRWGIYLGSLIVIEILTALALYFYFLPEVLEIAQNYGESSVGVSLVVSALLIKAFILSVIAIGITFAVKSLKAQNHLYATNKFKANALASFQAFLDSTDDDTVINQIIAQVAGAVYSQNVSGYLSADDSSAKIVDQESAVSIISKLLNR